MLGWFKKKFSKTEENATAAEAVEVPVAPIQETEENKPQEQKVETQIGRAHV